MGKTLLFADWCSVIQPLLMLIKIPVCKLTTVFLSLQTHFETSNKEIAKFVPCVHYKTDTDQQLRAVVPPGISYRSRLGRTMIYTTYTVDKSASNTDQLLCDSFWISRLLPLLVLPHT